MAQADSQTKIRPDLIKTSLHHLVIQKKKRNDCKETDREMIGASHCWRKLGENTDKQKRERWKFICEQDEDWLFLLFPGKKHV